MIDFYEIATKFIGPLPMDTATVITLCFTLLTPLFGLIIYMLKRIDNKIEKNADTSVHLEHQFTSLSEQFKQMKVDVEKSLIMGNRNERLSAEIDFLKRDMKTCFKKLDTINENIRKVSNG